MAASKKFSGKHSFIGKRLVILQNIVSFSSTDINIYNYTALNLNIGENYD